MLCLLAHVAGLVAVAALERAWPQQLRISDVAPALVLVFVACTGIMRGRVAGYAAGLLGGLLVGATGGRSFAAGLIGLMIVGLMAGHIRGRVFAEHVVVAPVLAILATLVAALVQLMLSPASHFIPWVAEQGWLMLYNALVSAPVYLYVRALARRWPPRVQP